MQKVILSTEQCIEKRTRTSTQNKKGQDNAEHINKCLNERFQLHYSL